MSHMVIIPTKVHDSQAVAAACRRLNLAEPTLGTVDFFNGKANGLVVKLPGWEYAIAIDTTSGQIRMDNYGGQWGEQAQLDKFLQMYAIEKTRQEARKKNLTLTEENLADGSVKLRISMGYDPNQPES